MTDPSASPRRPRDLARRALRRLRGDARLDDHERRLDGQHARLTQLQQRSEAWSRSATRSRNEYATAAHQLIAMEQRLAALESAPVEPGDDAARTESRQLVDEIRAEHQRIRARLSLMNSYEERLRRVESALLHAIELGQFPSPPNERVGADVVEARRSGAIPPDGTELPPPR